MLKLTGALFVFLASVGVGYSQSYELTLREKNLEQFLQVIFCLKGEIRCGNSSLADAFREAAGRCGKVYKKFLTEAAECMETATAENLETIISGCAEKHLDRLKVTKAEFRRIRMLGSRLGYLDKEMQIRQLELYEEEWKWILKQLRGELQEKKKVYNSLGIMGGIMAVLLFW